MYQDDCLHPVISLMVIKYVINTSSLSMFFNLQLNNNNIVRVIYIGAIINTYL